MKPSWSEINIWHARRDVTFTEHKIQKGIQTMSKNTVTVGVKRSYNVGNFEQVHVSVTYGAEVPEGMEREKAATKLAKTIPDTITDLFDRFAKAHKLQRVVTKKD